MANIQRNKPITLFVVWWVSAAAFTVFNRLFWGEGLVSLTPFAITISVTLLYFMPFLIVVYRQAKSFSIRWLTIATRVMLFYLIGVLAVFLIGFLIML